MFEIVDVNELFKRHRGLTKEELASFFDDCFKMIKKDLSSKKLGNVYASNDYPNKEIHLNDINNGMLCILYRDELVGAIGYLKGGIKEEFGLSNREEEYQEFLKKFDIDENNYYTLHRLFVLPQYQNQGAAKQLLKEIEKRFKNTTILFLVSPYNIPAFKMYEKLNYENLGSYPFYYGDFVVFKKVN